MKLKSVVALLATLGMASVASAGPIALFAGANVLEDDNREYLIKGQGNTNAGVLEIGDRLRGVVKFPTINEVNGPGSISPVVPELTGLFESQIVNIIGSTIIWGPSAAFQGTYGAGAMVALFAGTAGTTLNINGCASIVACEAAATDGTPWAVAGFGDADDQWVSINSNLNWATVTGLGAGTKVAFINYSLTLLQNNTGYQFAEQQLDCFATVGGPYACLGDGKTDISGSGDVLGGVGLTNGYGARSDIDATLHRIPEPGSLALIGLGFAGLGFSMRRRQK